MVCAPESLMPNGFPEVTVFASRVPACAAERAARAVGRVLDYRGIAGGARVRLTATDRANGPMLVQVNLRVRDIPARVQAVVGGIDDLTPVLARLDRQIVRVWAPWRPRPWPDLTAAVLTAPAEEVITRRKPVALQRGTPLEAAPVMDAMDYDMHLFTDAETGEDAVIYRAGPSGLRLARQHTMYPPGWSWSPATTTRPVPLIVNSRPTPVLSEAAAVKRVCEHRLRFLFFTDDASGRGRLLYLRYDGRLGLLTPNAGSAEGAVS